MQCVWFLWKWRSTEFATILVNHIRNIDIISNLLTQLASLFLRKFFPALDFIIALFCLIPVAVVSIELKTYNIANFSRLWKGLLACYKKSINIYMILVSRINSTLSWCQIESFCITSQFGESQRIMEDFILFFPKIALQFVFQMVKNIQFFGNQRYSLDSATVSIIVVVELAKAQPKAKIQITLLIVRPLHCTMCTL